MPGAVDMQPAAATANESGEGGLFIHSRARMPVDFPAAGDRQNVARIELDVAVEVGQGLVVPLHASDGPGPG